MITQRPAFNNCPDPAEPRQPAPPAQVSAQVSALASPTMRIALIGCGFFALTTTLLLLQPQNGPAPAPLTAGTAATTQVQVSRAETGLDLLATDAPRVDPLDALVLASIRATTPDTRAPRTATPAANANDAALKALSEGVLAGFGVPSTLDGVAPAPRPDPMRDMTAGVLAALSDTRAPAKPDAALETLISRALHQGKSDAYLDALLNEAAAAGHIAIPAALQTNDGKVDTATLIATLTKQSPPDPNAAPRSESFAGGKGVEVRVVQRAGQTEQYNFYTVQPGDSLGAIARKFYGDARFYTKIFDANRQFLSTPNKIRPGQRLSIPKLAAS